jgi:hypothetical protein
MLCVDHIQAVDLGMAEILTTAMCLLWMQQMLLSSHIQGSEAA